MNLADETNDAPVGYAYDNGYTFSYHNMLVWCCNPSPPLDNV